MRDLIHYFLNGLVDILHPQPSQVVGVHMAVGAYTTIAVRVGAVVSGLNPLGKVVVQANHHARELNMSPVVRVQLP
jgi:hypothetical protein